MIAKKTLIGETTSVSSYAYDSLDRLVHETTSTNGSSAFDIGYSYDLAGNRTSKILNGQTTTCTLGIGNRLISTTTDSNAVHSIAIQGTSTEPVGLREFKL